MTAQTKLGGVDRDALFRIWFLFYGWALVGSFLTPGPHGFLFAWLFGSALTCGLLYKRSAWAGIVGYVVSGTATAMTLPLALWLWGLLPFGYYDFAEFFRSIEFLRPAGLSTILSRRLFYTALAFVPTVVLAIHVASRHRLLRGFEGRMVQYRHARVITPSSYYLLTPR